MRSTSCFALDDFLSPEKNSNLLQETLARSGQFQAATTSEGLTDFRQAQVLYNLPPLANEVVDLISGLYRSMATALDVTEFDLTSVESQITAHNDGHYFRQHNDNANPEVAARVLSYVYYFCSQPQKFSGGELIIYGSEQPTIVVPKNNLLIFFPSHLQHEVCKIDCTSKEFGHSRFTLNGWIRR